jgi:hypothetical protein
MATAKSFTQLGTFQHLIVHFDFSESLNPFDISVFGTIQIFIFAILIAAVAANVAYPKPAYPASAYPAAYPPKSYDYVSLNQNIYP